jgi:exo-beta-1,3-glucanase (GH17 family)
MRLAQIVLLLLLLGGGAFAQGAGTLPGGRRPAVFQRGAEWTGLAVAFSPYRDGQGPLAGMPHPSDAEITEDLRLVSRYWKVLRMYDCTEVTVRTLSLIQKNQLPLKVIVGAWINGKDEAGNRLEIDTAIRLANAYPDIVLSICVGNEACAWWAPYRIEPAALVRHIRQVRAAIAQPVSCADDHDYWRKEESKVIAAELDFIIAHIYPLWLGRQVEQSTDCLDEIYDAIARMHPGTPIAIGEAGWATKHDASRKAKDQEGDLMKGEVSVSAQLHYLRQHYRWVRERRIPTVLFEAFDENWKGGGAGTSPDAVEKHWGVFDSQRRPKASFVEIIRDYYPSPKS